MSDQQNIEANIAFLVELREQLRSLRRPRNKEGKEISAKIVRAVIDRGRDAESRGYRFVLNGGDDSEAAAVREEIYRAIADHLFNLPNPANAPSRFAISVGDRWLFDKLEDGDDRKRIGKLVALGKRMSPPMFDTNTSDEAHIDRIERNRDFYRVFKWCNEHPEGT